MLRISKLADYATMIITHCAEHASENFTAKKIAAATKIALPTVSKLLKLLAKQHLLTSQRGAQGGYALAYPPEAISIADIINAIDGPISLMECHRHHEPCKFIENCKTMESWQKINIAINQTLANISVADMLTPSFSLHFDKRA